MVPRPFSLQPLKFPAQAVASSQDDPGSFPVRIFLSLYFYASSRVSFKTLTYNRHRTTKYPFFVCLTVQFGPKEVYYKHRMRFKKVPVSNSQPGWKKFCQEKRSGGKNSVWEFFCANIGEHQLMAKSGKVSTDGKRSKVQKNLVKVGPNRNFCKLLNQQSVEKVNWPPGLTHKEKRLRGLCSITYGCIIVL